MKTESATTIALRNAKKYNLILTPAEVLRIKEIIKLLQFFKDGTDKCEVESDISITLILPTLRCFDAHLREKKEVNLPC